MGAMLRVRSGAVTLAVEVSGAGTPVVYGHGLGGCPQYAREQWGTGASECRRITFDARGHGESSPVYAVEEYQRRRMGAVLPQGRLEVIPGVFTPELGRAIGG